MSIREHPPLTSISRACPARIACDSMRSTDLRGAACGPSKTAPVYKRAPLGYPSDRTAAEWEPIRPLIPRARRGGNKRTVDLRKVVNGPMYALSTGCQWRAIPEERKSCRRSTSRSSNDRIMRRDLSCCLNAGLWSARSHGSIAAAAWQKIGNAAHEKHEPS